MQVSVKGKQIDVGEALSGHVATLLETVVGKYFGNAMDASAVFSREAHLIRCDVTVHIGRDILVQGEGEGGDAYAAFEGAADRIGKRLRRHKRRLRAHHGKSREPHEVLPARSYVLAAEPEPEGGEPETVPSAAAAASQDGADETPVIIAEMATEIPMLTVSEAVMRMDLADVGALLFRNRAHGGLNLVYRRRDGNIGWVDPDLAASSGSPRTGS